ncbi:MAG: DNA cytosine methyltransferase [Prevotella sp.]|nr:DNA cytosine methyltransferase [Prevotella sp.]
MDNIKLLYIDLFCGAGGTSTGVEYATLNGDKCAKVIACVNHDPNAILSHAANHPDTLHFTEDIRTLELSPLIKHLEGARKRYPEAYVVLWSSLECTNFSRAKGGQPRDADSRTLAEHLFRYIEAINPDYIQIENVEEFMCWGALDENGKPISKDQGSDYMRWVRNVRAYGYDFDWRILNAADFGAYTSRKRFFGQFAKIGLPIAFPLQSYAKYGDDGGMFHQYKKWKAVREVLDFSDEGESIFGRKKPLVEKTLERIYAGLIKFVAGMTQKEYTAFLVKYNSMNREGHYSPPSIDEPCPTVACQNRLGIASVSFLSKQFSGRPEDKNISVDGPAGTITTVDHHALISTYYGNGGNSPVSEPAPTITTKDRLSLVYIVNQFSGGGQLGDVNEPSSAVLTTPKQNLVTVDKFLMNPYSFKSNGGSVDKPCFTLIARMDKMPPYLVTTEGGGLGIAFFEDDSPMTRKIKEFMAIYGIVDIKMRMLKVSELKKIMGFPEDYVLIGTQAEQKKFIGNAVEVNMSRVLCEALCEKLINRRI